MKSISDKLVEQYSADQWDQYYIISGSDLCDTDPNLDVIVPNSFYVVKRSSMLLIKLRYSYYATCSFQYYLAHFPSTRKGKS